MITETIKYSSSFHWNSDGLMEYIMVIHPAATVTEKVIQEKQDFFNHYGEKIPTKTKPHITVATFLAKEAMEATLSRWINNICNQYQSFDLALNNYSGFPPHTIYLRVQDHTPIINLVQQFKTLDNFIRASDCPPLKTPAKPHLSIAKRLPLYVYEKAIKEYSQKDFHESFKVEELILLKRSHQFETCKIVNRYAFSLKSQIIRQDLI